MVETPLARYHLDSRGALLTRVELTVFDGYDEDGERDGVVQLVKSGDELPGEGLLGLDLFRGGQELSSAGWNFACDLPEGQDKLSIDSPRSLTFLFRDDLGGELVKTFTFHPESYQVDVRVSGKLVGALTGVDRYGLDLEQGILSTEKNRKDDLGSFKNFFLLGEKLEKKGLNSFKNGGQVTSPEGTVQWAATKNKYFTLALIPEGSLQGKASLLGSKETSHLGYNMEFSLRGGRTNFDEDFQLYAGPIFRDTLMTYDRGLERVQDLGWAWIRPISVGIKWLMGWIYKFIPNYGVVIILLSVFTKVLFYRLSHKSFKSMKDMQGIQPELHKLQEKYKDNKQKLNEATMKLYKEHGVNPLGGCLPMVLQMPVFFALFSVLRSAVELRGAGFVGWIHDLSYMDVLYTLPFEIPMLGNFINNSISLLPILMGVSMWLQTRMGGTGMGMSTGPSQAGAQAAMMNKIMPFFMTFIFYRMPSGLVLYWLVNNILTAVQQYYIHKGLDQDGKVVPGQA
jgi:YidC/Oxa1 family membrane protein insertase